MFLGKITITITNRVITRECLPHVVLEGEKVQVGVDLHLLIFIMYLFLSRTV